MEFYKAEENRYADMIYRRCGRSGILLPAVSLGLWHNFGSVDVFGNFIQIAHAAFDHGVTHFDLANNYGPAYGSAEENFGRILKKGLGAYRDEMIISLCFLPMVRCFFFSSRRRHTRCGRDRMGTGEAVNI